jgi:nucleotide-binding universal stress UspA family protein
MTRETESPVQRILVALDTSASARAALAAALDLAVELDAELTGLFVEDDNLLRLAALPLAGRAHYSPAGAQALDEAAMARALRAEAAQLRRSLETEATRLRLHWSFHVVRGSVEREVVSAAQAVDLVVMGTAGRNPGTGSRLGSTARAIARSLPRSVLFLRPGERLGRPVVTVHDGSASADRALALALRLARSDGHELVVLSQPPEEAGATGAQGDVRGRLAAHGLEGRVSPLGPVDAKGLARALRAAGARLLVLGLEHPLCTGPGFEELLARAGCAVVVVR